MKTEQLRKALQTRPRLALLWAKRFHFCESEHHHEYPEYDERAFLAYQTLLWASNKDIRLIKDWVIEEWKQNVRYYRCKSFGKAPNIEFDNVRQFVEHLMDQMIKNRPRILRSWIIQSFNNGGNYNHLVQKWLDSMFALKPGEALGVIRELYVLYPQGLDNSSQSVYFNVRSRLRAFYQIEPERILSFFDRYAKNTRNMGRMMDEVLK